MSGPLLLPVLADDRVLGWPKNAKAPEIGYPPAAEAFAQHYPTDAHFAAYSVPSLRWRLTLGALLCLAERDGWPMVLLVADIDHPWKREKPKTDAAREALRQRVDGWWADEQAKIAALLAAHPGAFIYRSRSGGYRVVYLLASPVVIRTVDDKEGWRLRYRRELLYLARQFGIVGDPACADITRLYRLPFVTPEGEAPTTPELLGDPAALGAWGHEPSAAELDADASMARTLATLNPSSWGPVARSLTPEGGSQGGQGEGTRLEPGDQDEARLIKRAVGYLSKRTVSVSGAGGGPELFGAAQGVVRGFCLGPSTGAALLWQHFNPRCQPPWPREEIERACRNAAEYGRKPWGYLRDAEGGEAGLRKKARDVSAQTRKARPSTHRDNNPENEMHDQADDHDQADEQQGPASGPRPAPSTDERPRILVDHNLARIVVESVAALATVHSLNLYARNDALVQVLRATESAKRKDDGMPYIRPLPVDALWEMLSRHIDFYRLTFRKDEGWVETPCAPPPQAVKTLAARGTWPGLRPIVGVLETPFLRPDGSVCSAPGYDEESGYLLWTSEHFPGVPAAPSPDDARRALATLQDVFCDFPFAGEASAAVPLAAILTILARPYLGAANTPGFLFDANTRATGKSLICDVVALIATSRPAPKTGYPHDEPEMSKLLSSVALDGVPLLAFDNVTSTFGGGDLDRVLTAAGPVAFRVLGALKNRQMPWRTIVMATGNNLQVRGDTTRRVLLCAQETAEEKPEEREDFRYPDLRRHVLEHRGELVAAGLTLLRAYLAAGAPRGSVRPLGSFEGWSRLVAGALVWAGAPNPLDALAEATRDDDPHKTALRVLLMQWTKLDPSGFGITAREILALLFPPATKENPGGKPGEGLDELRDAVELLCESPMGKAPDARRLGTRLRSFQKRRLGNRRLNAKDGGHDKVARWVVEDLTKPRKPAGSAGSAGSVPYDRGASEKSEEEDGIGSDRGARGARGHDPADPADPAPWPATSTPPPASATQATAAANDAPSGPPSPAPAESNDPPAGMGGAGG